MTYADNQNTVKGAAVKVESFREYGRGGSLYQSPEQKRALFKARKKKGGFLALPFALLALIIGALTVLNYFTDLLDPLTSKVTADTLVLILFIALAAAVVLCILALFLAHKGTRFFTRNLAVVALILALPLLVYCGSFVFLESIKSTRLAFWANVVTLSFAAGILGHFIYFLAAFISGIKKKMGSRIVFALVALAIAVYYSVTMYKDIINTVTRVLGI